MSVPSIHLARGGGPRSASEANTDIGRGIPVASPERIPTAPGPLVEELKAPQPKALYRGQTLVYVERGDQHDVVDAHWDEYLRLRRCTPRVVRLHSTLREMRSKLFSEGAVI